MINTVINAPVNLYFEKTPIGRIINKFSKDINILSVTFGMFLAGIVATFAMLGQTFTVALY